MPSVQINSSNITTFGYSATWDLFNKRVIFDTAGLTVYNGSSGSGIFSGIKISFGLVDQDGIELATIDFDDTAKYIVPSVTQEFIVDLSALSYAFLFQNYKITGAIKDANGTVYTIPSIYKKVCEPVNFNESGYVPGIFQVTADCVNNSLTVKELTNLTYDNLIPDSKTKAGTFYYPTGTIASISFANTPWSNNIVYTGENRVVNTTTALYSLGDDIYVEVQYQTDNAFDITCSNKMSSIMCCIIDLQSQYTKNCNNAIGQNAKQKLDGVTIPLLAGLLKEINGQDASNEAELIRKTLKCNCGTKSINQNEPTPINPSIYNIVIQGVGGTTVPSATVVGSTKTYFVGSNVYQVTKGDTGDLSYTIQTDTATANTVKYKLTFNKTIEAGYILAAISANSGLITTLNSLINFTNFNIDLTSLNGSCIINLSSLNYFLSYKVASSADGFKNIVINGTTYTPGSPIAVNSVGAIETYLNGLALGTFEVNFTNGVTGAYLNILTNANANTVTSATLTIAGNDNVVPFQKTNKSLIAVLQAIIDYLCGLTALQVALGNTLTLYQIDYNGNVVTIGYTPVQTQNDFNQGIETAIYNIITRLNTLTGVTCAKIQAIFPANPLATFNVASDGILAFVNGSCVALSGSQLGTAVMSSVNAYASVKSLFCAVDCNVPATCPDISAINASIISGNIGVYGVTFDAVTAASQILTVKYRINGTLTWTVATNNLGVFANGNVSGTSPYQITGLTPGATYDLQVLNNCGGVGFVQQITVPTSTVYTASFLLDNILYLICGNSTTTLYSSSPFATGVKMYTNIGLTTPITGFSYIADSSGNIHQLNTLTGVVGVDTGSDCTNGTAGSYILGNNTSTICAASPVTLYTNGAFSVGGTLYSDVSLTLPVTGSAYVVNGGIIYNLNSVTGQIGNSTGLSCTAIYNGSVSNQSPNGNVINSVTISGVPVVYQSGNNLPQTSGKFGFFDSPITHSPGTFGVTVNISAGINPPTLVRVTGTDGVGYDQAFIGDGNYNFPFIVFGGIDDLWRVEVDPLA